MAPNINSATARVLDAAGIQTLVAEDAGCCGAIRLHLRRPRRRRSSDMRRNIDAWWPLVATGGVEAIVMNASGCGVTVKEYGHSLRHDPAYADKARPHRRADARPVASCCPTSCRRSRSGWRRRRSGRALAFHPPCTLQHGQQLRGGVETHLRALGFDVEVAPNEAHLCCGSAGTYSVLQPELAHAAARPQARPPRPRSSPRPSSRPTSAASSTCRAARRLPCGTGWRCWTRRSPRAEPVACRRTSARRAARNEHRTSFASRLGPGLITGAADDDPSGIATYSQAGAQFRFSLVWTLFLTCR